VVDLELRQAERDAARDGDHQRLYVLLERAGRHDEARALFLDHPIRVEAVVRYQYLAYVSNSNYNDFGGVANELTSYDLEQLVQQVVDTKLSASRISYVQRQATYQILGEEVVPAFGRGPLKPVVIDQEELLAFKTQVRSHPAYMRGATAEQFHEEAEYARLDAVDAERAQRSIEANQRRLQAEEKFQNNSLTQVEEVCMKVVLMVSSLR
jgi:hypothetical protein